MNLGFSGEMIFLAALGLILFGPKRLPEIARSVGRFIAELKHATNEFQGQLTREIGDVDISKDAAIAGPMKSLNSLVERIRSANVAPSADKAMMALVGPPPGQERFAETKFLDNISRISGFLAGNPEGGGASKVEERRTAEPVAAEAPASTEPAAQPAATADNGSGTGLN